jgi:hypothetical protein
VTGILRRLFSQPARPADPPRTQIPSDGMLHGKVALVAGVAKTIYGGHEPLEVVGESFHQDTLWMLTGQPRGSRVRVEITAVLEPEPTNPVDPHAIQVLISNMPVGHLAREDAHHYLPGLHQLIRTNTTGGVGLEGVIAGGGTQSDRRGYLGVFLNHNPSDFGIRHHYVAMQGILRTGYSQARATDLEDDSYDLSWADALSSDDWIAAGQLEQLLVEERDPIDRHFMFAEMSKCLYRCRQTHSDALARFDDTCRRHDEEMASLQPALIAKFSVVPMIEMYRQAAIRWQKAKDWREMRWWAERGIEIYGEQAAHPEDVLDLEKRAMYAAAKLGASPPPAARPMAQAAVEEVETLVCVSCGQIFQRQRLRGRKPQRCPSCQAL